MNPENCSMPDCDKELGPDALVFEHDGKPAGGICAICLDDAPVIKVVFKKDGEGVYVPQEVRHIDNPL